MAFEIRDGFGRYMLKLADMLTGQRIEPAEYDFVGCGRSAQFNLLYFQAF